MKKRIIIACLIAALALCPLASAGAAVTAKATVALGFVRTVAKYGTVYLRTGGGMSYPPIGYATNGDSLVVHYKGNFWYRVTMTSGDLNGRTGWMHSSYIDTITLKNKNNKNGWGAMARIRDKYEYKDIRLRSGPGSWYASQARVNFEDPIIILSKATSSSSWYIAQLGYTRKFGYIYKPFITNGASATAEVDTPLYKRAKASSAILEYIDAGEEFYVLNVQSRWSKVEFDDYTGYVRNSDYDFSAFVM